MKNFILLVAILFFPLNKGKAQYCDPKDITTDPAAPVNKEKPAKVNTFNWMQDTYKLNSAYVTSPLMYSPFFQPDNSLIDHVRTSKDMYPKDGWELIKKDFGYKDDGTATSIPTGNPYLVLYNKYTGILRVFVAVADRQAFNGAQIEVKFSSLKQTSLFTQARQLTALDTYMKDPILFSVSGFNNDYLKWFMADFPMMYDPCTCDFLSKVHIQIKLVDEANIYLIGTTTGKLVALKKDSGTVDNSKSLFSLGGLLEEGVPAIKKAYNSFKSADNWVQKQKEGIETKTGASATEQTKKKQDLALFQDLLKSSGFLRAGLSAIPYAAAALDLVDFFTGGGRKTSSAATEVRLHPMSMDMTSTFKGTITATYPYRDILFWTPGSNNLSEDAGDYPYYNEILGVFNLLRTPEIWTAEEIPDCSLHPPCIIYHDDGTYEEIDCSNCLTKTSYLQVQDTIRYLLNPASGLEIQDMQAAVVIENPSSFKTTVSSPFIPEIYDKGKITVYRTPYVPFSAFQGYVFRDIEVGGSKYYCKIILNLKRKDTEEAQNVLMVFKFPFRVNRAKTIYYSGSVPEYNDNGILFTEEIKDITYNEYTGQYALNRLIIGPNVVFKKGGILQASKEVQIKSGTLLSAGTSIQIKIPDETNYLFPLSSNEIKSFCQSPTYRTRSRGFGLRVDGGSSNNNEMNSEKQQHEFETLLYPAHPNPSDGPITISYSIADLTMVKLYVTNFLGVKIAEVVSQTEHPSGYFEVVWQADQFPSGMYFYTLETATYKETKKVMIVK